MRYKRLLLQMTGLIWLSLFLVACARGPTPTSLPVPPALTPVGTPTSVPTEAPMPTAAPTPTLTDTPTGTPTATPSPRPVLPTVTSMLEPSAYLGMARRGGRLGKIWNLADVRYGSHPDRLRVVWEMVEPGDHVPLYEAVEVDNAADPFPTGHDPSWGAARIDLVVSDLYAYDFPLGKNLPIVLLDNPRVTRIGLYPTFSDSHLGFSIGLKEPAAYEVYELTDPVRIVIDVLYGD